jgi:nicotinate-nucleotide pyrophosphorylase (carboxylating)
LHTQRMAGVATATQRLCARIPAQSKTRILDTRKTAPGLRCLDKLAVRHGGGLNHRYALYDMVLIKDNHVDAAGSLTAAVHQAQRFLHERGQTGRVQIEVETRTLEEVREACALHPPVDRIMLDNMVKVDAGQVDVSRLQQALDIVRGRIATEASGNINEHTIAAIAATNVDYASVGAITYVIEWCRVRGAG